MKKKNAPGSAAMQPLPKVVERLDPAVPDCASNLLSLDLLDSAISCILICRKHFASFSTGQSGRDAKDPESCYQHQHDRATGDDDGIMMELKCPDR